MIIKLDLDRLVLVLGKILLWCLQCAWALLDVYFGTSSKLTGCLQKFFTLLRLSWADKCTSFQNIY